MTVHIYIVSANFSKRDEVVRFAGLFFDKAKCVIISMLKGGLCDLSACDASLCCMWLTIPFLDRYWVTVVVHNLDTFYNC